MRRFYLYVSVNSRELALAGNQRAKMCWRRWERTLDMMMVFCYIMLATVFHAGDLGKLTKGKKKTVVKQIKSM